MTYALDPALKTNELAQTIFFGFCEMPGAFVRSILRDYTMS